jgi:hypothetical protein
MNAPPQHGAPPPGRSQGGAAALLRQMLRTGRGRLLALVSAFFIYGSLAATLQGGPPPGSHMRALSLAWWGSPLVLDPPLARIGCHLRAVHAVDDRQVIVGGALGLVARSDDGGYTWVRETLKWPKPQGGEGGADVQQIDERQRDQERRDSEQKQREDERRYQENEKQKEKEQEKEKEKKSKKAAGSWLDLLEGTAFATVAGAPDRPAAPPAPPSSEVPAKPAPLHVALEVRPLPLLPTVLAIRDGQRPAILTDEAEWFEPAPSSAGAAPGEAGRVWQAVERDENVTLRLRSAQILNAVAPRSAMVVDGEGQPGHERIEAPDGGLDAAALDLDGKNLIVLTEKGKLMRSTAGGGSGFTLLALPFNEAVRPRAFHFRDGQRGWAVGDAGAIATTADGGTHWQVQQPARAGYPALFAVHVAPNGLHGWAVGEKGTVLRTNDGGDSWYPVTQPGGVAAAASVRLPPPWYFATLVMALLVGVPALRRTSRAAAVSAAAAEESVADVLVSDRPLETPSRDVLDLNGIALGLSRFLRNEGTLAPLTLAITGEWGTGKSSLMNLLRADLRRYGFRPVWFNAWHHQKEEHLLAALLQSIRMHAVPGWWSWQGLKFRAQLLLIRGWRRWLPLAALLFVLAFSLAYELQHPYESVLDHAWGMVKNVVTEVKGGNLHAALRALGAQGSALGVLGSALALLATFRRGVRAFGVNPGALLAGVSGAAKVADLDAQTSFRQKFAGELSDVTRALGSRSMILFIDDLDRCRPDQVVEMLEAINFVVSSGDCFVIMGMAPARVVPCIALSFKDVAEEMAAPAGAEAPNGGAAQGAAETPRDKRARFAREYLDKLINIEVPVPAPSAEQAGYLLVEQAASVSIAASPLKQTLRALVQGVVRRRRMWPILPIGVFMALGWVAGGVGGEANRQATIAAEAEATAGRPAAGAATTAGGTAGAAGAQQASTPASDPGRRARRPPPPRPDPGAQRPEVTMSGPSVDAVRWVVLAALLMLAVAAAWTLLNRRPDLVVRDSATFTRALQIWNDVVFQVRPTPRALKRFLNRVRYLAMHQRPAAASRSQIERLMEGDEIKRPPPKAIPEPVLVALAALHEIGAFEEDRLFRSTAGEVPLGNAAVEAALKLHMATFGTSWTDLIAHAAVYSQQVRGIRVH